MQISTINPLDDQSFCETLINAFNEALIITDKQGVVLKVNEAFSILTGFSEKEVLGQSQEMLYSSKNGVQFCEQLRNKLEREGFLGRSDF